MTRISPPWAARRIEKRYREEKEKSFCGMERKKCFMQALRREIDSNSGKNIVRGFQRIFTKECVILIITRSNQK